MFSLDTKEPSPFEDAFRSLWYSPCGGASWWLFAHGQREIGLFFVWLQKQQGWRRVEDRALLHQMIEELAKGHSVRCDSAWDYLYRRTPRPASSPGVWLRAVVNETNPTPGAEHAKP